MSYASKRLIRGFDRAVDISPEAATFLKIDTGGDDPMSADPSITATSESVTGILGAYPVMMASQDSGVMGEARAFTVKQSSVTRQPTESDRVKLSSGDTYNIVKVDPRPGLYVLWLAGTTTDPSAAEDILAPTASSLSLTGGTLQFDYALTASELAYHKLRYRITASGDWADTGYNGTLQTSIGGTIDGINDGTYEVVVYLKDAAGNISRGISMGTVVALPNIGG